MGHYETCVTVHPGSSKVFIGVDVADRFSTIDGMLSTQGARILAENLIKIADQVDAEIAEDAAADALLEDETA